MVNNNALPVIAVDPETFAIDVDVTDSSSSPLPSATPSQGEPRPVVPSPVSGSG